MTDAEKPGTRPTPLSPQAQAWLEENKEAIAAHNERIAKHGTLITPIWLEPELSEKTG